MVTAAPARLKNRRALSANGRMGPRTRWGENLGAPSFSPHRSRVSFAVSATPQTTLAQLRELGQVTTMRVLVVEDDEKIASFVIKGLKQNGYAVDHAVDGEHGLDLATAINYYLVILDLMLPKLDGLSLLRRLRQEKIRTPVLILSARANVDDRVRGLQAGGDDYLTKPFAFSELLARVQALIRRAGQTVEQTQLSVADLSMNVITREVTRDGQRIELHPREYSLLEFLLRHAGRPVTKTMILEHIWDFHFDPQTNVVDVLIHRLRAKIDKNFPLKLIQTIRGVGYVVKAS
jgi:two-component system, OmpR family, response regulator